MPKLPGIGKRIERRLVELGYSGAGRPDVAKVCAEKSYRPQYLYAWVSGRTSSWENLVRLAADLGVTPSPWTTPGASASSKTAWASVRGGSQG
jgi:hypothetical protein